LEVVVKYQRFASLGRSCRTIRSEKQDMVECSGIDILPVLHYMDSLDKEQESMEKYMGRHNMESQQE
jgi:hypothetical protein